MPLKLYAIGYLATRPEEGGEPPQIQIGHTASYASAESADEATEIGLRFALERMPITDGWRNHTATATEIHFEALWTALRAEVFRLGIVSPVAS